MDEDRVPRERDEGAALKREIPKKPYVRPAIVYRQPLEALASVCTGDGGKGPSDSCVLLYS